jgi:hypothetical protein
LTAAAGPHRKAGMNGQARERLIESRLRDLAALCGALLGGTLLSTALVVRLAVSAGGDLASETPGTLAFVLGSTALLTVLLSSAVRAAILRRAREREEYEVEEEIERATPQDAAAAARARLGAYVRATRASFSLLAVAAALGLLAALAGHSPFYGLVACTVSALAMAVRWPRRAILDDLLAAPPAR